MILFNKKKLTNSEYRIEIRFSHEKDLNLSKSGIAKELFKSIIEKGLLDDLNYQGKAVLMNLLKRKVKYDEYVENVTKEYRYNLSFIWTYIESALDSFYYEYIRKHNMTDKELCKPELCDKIDKEGSLILTFSLVFGFAADSITVYSFVSRFIERISSLDYGDIHCNTTFREIRNGVNVNHANGWIDRLSIINTLLLAALAAALLAYCISNDNEKERMLQNVEQIMKKEVQDAINQEKLNYLFYRSLDKSGFLQNDSTKTQNK